MKMQSIVVAFGFLAALGIGQSAFAHGNGRHHHHNPPPHYHDEDPFLLTLISESVTLTELSEATSESSKVAIVNANADAVLVLNGEAATDLFLNGKAAAEAALKVTFESDADAALAILELAELFQ